MQASDTLSSLPDLDLLDDANRQLKEKAGNIEGYTGKTQNLDQSIEQYAQSSAEN